MPPLILTDCRAFLDAWNVSGDLNKVALNYAAELQDATAFGMAGKARKGGLKDVSLALEGFWDGGTDLTDEILFNRLGLVGVPVTIVPSAAVDGDLAFSFPAGFAAYQPGASIGEMLKFSVDAQGSDGMPLVRGIIAKNGTVAGAGNGSAFNQGLVGATQDLYASLHVLAISGGGTWTFKIQSDDAGGFGSPTDRITFNAVTVKGSQWAPPVSGPIASDNQWRATWSVAGGSGNSITFVVFLGIQ